MVALCRHQLSMVTSRHRDARMYCKLSTAEGLDILTHGVLLFFNSCYNDFHGNTIDITGQNYKTISTTRKLIKFPRDHTFYIIKHTSWVLYIESLTDTLS